MDSERVIARKGDQVTCENGHVICTVASDITWGSLWQTDVQFTDWKQPEPRIGTPATDIACTICGARWFTHVLHFKDGYRE